MRKAGLGGLTGDVDDAAAFFLRRHYAGGRLKAEEGAGQIDADDGVPVLRRHLKQGLHDVADAGVIDPDIQAAVRRDRMVGQGLNLNRITHVAGEGRSRPAQRAQIAGDGLHLLGSPDHGAGRRGVARGADIGNHHRRPL